MGVLEGFDEFWDLFANVVAADVYEGVFVVEAFEVGWDFGDRVREKGCGWDSEFVVSGLGYCKNMISVDEGAAGLFVVVGFYAVAAVAFIMPEDKVVDCH